MCRKINLNYGLILIVNGVGRHYEKWLLTSEYVTEEYLDKIAIQYRMKFWMKFRARGENDERGNFIREGRRQ